MRHRLIAAVRRAHGHDVLDPKKLVVGFARRFATYKRADLIFHDPDRLADLVRSGLQVVIAGKAHPRDTAGQDLLERVLAWTQDARFRDRVVFVPGYDMSWGRLLTQGADVWLNTPVLPREASGTSGQKAALNGGLNCSILDGWWPEACDGENGWAIGNADAEGDATRSRAEIDARDATALYEILEHQVLPTFAEPEVWAHRSAHAIATCLPRFNTSRMVRDYLDQMYDPA